MMVSPANSGDEKVPVDEDAVALVFMVSVFEPLLMVIWVLAAGGLLKLPLNTDCVALVVIVKTFAPLVMVIVPPAVGGAVNVPVWVAATPPMFTLQSFFRG
jgi:hypothetical protein